MDKLKNDRLKILFGKIISEEPSKGFEEKLMLQIHEKAKEQIKKQALRSRVSMYISIAGAIIGLIVIPSVVLYYLGLQVKIEPLNLDFSIIQFNPFIISLSAIVLFLMMADTLIRKHISDKKNR